MSPGGTRAHLEEEDLPELVRRAVALTHEVSFDHSCRPEVGRLLRVLAGGVAEGGLVGETGTGLGIRHPAPTAGTPSCSGLR